MADRVTISNLVLAKAGTSERIVDPADDGRAAEVLRFSWDIVRQATIRGGSQAPKWNFATRFADLAARAINAQRPMPYGWGAAYPEPADCLRIVDIGGLAGRIGGWKVMDGEILTADAAGPLRVEYLIDVVETALWDASFTLCFATGLAATVAATLGADASLRRELDKTYAEQLAAAAKVDARENPPTVPEESDWLLARWGGGGDPWRSEWRR